MNLLDWVVIFAYILFVLLISYFFSRKREKNTGEFFLSGRRLPWYIAGTGMVATTFAADTPLAVTELVADYGIAGNWLWWNMLFGGMLTVFFFSKLWRRANIQTDCEFVAIRYSGKAADFLRAFRAIYIGLFMNVLVISWVNLAMVKIVYVLFPEVSFLGINSLNIAGFKFTAYHLWVALIMLFVAVYASYGGLSSVSYVDAFQFFLSMTACIVLAIIAVNHESVGGIDGLKARLPEHVFSFLPEIGEKSSSSTQIISLSWIAFFVFFGMQWWASWYPGAEPGGGGYIAQRMMATKNEKHALGATLWFQIAHYALRPWPWIIVALVSLVMFPQLPHSEKGNGFVLIIKSILPNGLLGFLIAAFLAAYMSTLASQIVWGASYVINDFLKPFVLKNKKEKLYVLWSRIATVFILIISLFITTKIERISDVWKFMLEYSAGIGLVLILRWYWWRINAWSEIAAIIAPFFMYPVVKHFNIQFPLSLPLIVLWSTLVWLTVTFLTKPTDEKKLTEFYNKIRPGGIGWKKFAQLTGQKSDFNFFNLFVLWLSSCLMIIFFLFAIGKLIFKDYWAALLYFILCIGLIFIVFKNFNKTRF